MKRDMDLARKILFEIENTSFTTGIGFELKIDGYSNHEVNYHCLLLKEAGLIEVDQPIYGGAYRPTRLTWEGHEFLDSARDDKRWEKAKSAMSQVGGFVFDIGKQLLIQYLKTELKLS